MKKKYFAYLHANHHWVIKPYLHKAHFNEYLQDGFCKGSMIRGLILPFNVEREEEKEGWINLADVEPKRIGDHPALLHIKEMMGKIDWNKG